MRRWNGWGEQTREFPVPGPLVDMLTQVLGPGCRPVDVGLADVVAGVEPSRLPSGDLISADPADRVRHARGQSFPDLVAVRSGRLGAVPDAVAYPLSTADVRSLLGFADDHDAHVIPFGGGTSVVGGVTAPVSEVPVLTVDLARLDRLERLDERERLATFGAGVVGPQVEARLRAHGLTLGHFPQSFELSTLGGWVATRSSGQQSLGYGRIEDLFAGGRLESPVGTLELPPFPASAAGPDQRQVVLGSEGRLGILTEATVRIRPVPEVDDVHAVFFPSWDQGLVATRQIAQAGVPLSMLRLSTGSETATSLALAAHSRKVAALERALAVRHLGTGKCLLLMGVTGTAGQARRHRREALTVARRHGGVHIGRALGRRWKRDRFRQPYLRNGLWERGYGVDTVETATTWSRVPAVLAAVEEALRDALADFGERVLVGSHLSHVYPTGSSIYATFVFRLGGDAEETLLRWERLKAAASVTVVAHGATISHQHGVGLDHRDYLMAEKGEVGMRALRDLTSSFDPDGRMNPGKLVR